MRPIRLTGVVGTSVPVPLDIYVPKFSVNYTLTGAGAVEVTLDDIFDATITPTWIAAPGPPLVDPVRALRGTGMAAPDILTVIQQGTQ